VCSHCIHTQIDGSKRCTTWWWTPEMLTLLETAMNWHQKRLCICTYKCCIIFSINNHIIHF
jgi:hypothetical protein